MAKSLGLSLTSLSTSLGSKSEAKGEPLELSVDDIIVSPTQPRRHFDQEALDELAASIKASKVNQPISVKSKNKDGKYVLNFGERRLRASIIAGKKTIPAFIDDHVDEYGQVTENLQRNDLTPLEIAQFIAGRLQAGDKKSVIAQKLGVRPDFVSQYLALSQAPEFIQRLGQDRKIGARTLYDLVQAHKDFPEAVEKFVSEDGEVTRARLGRLLEELRLQPDPPADEFSSGRSANETAVASKGKKHKTKEPAKTQTILLNINGRIAELQPGPVKVMFKDTGEVSEVDLTSVQVALLEVAG
ncbi:ParB/RepB/Spo0J family partition protein [Pseudomonas luteola]|uniref:ParB/RepB/Spo0J family partition protein n=1 Tax=Pseudomonas luteola TaxID=47886 RepID=UPI000F7849FB|nr:ParB/RepB/Spo0J family partition protein [Pseudomonas luteola]RRW40502.1 ParB/RepB/Spo0J family partition protein [Pseudomonas luteola]